MKKVLIIEDDSFLQGLEATKIIKSGFNVIAAQTGEEAMVKILEPGINIILLDLLLPNFDGYNILSKIRSTETTKHIPVIVFSNLSEEKDINKAKELGATEVMVKSNFSLEELIGHMNKILA
jgi:DNA-binding response OmpR family regulator